MLDPNFLNTVLSETFSGPHIISLGCQTNFQTNTKTVTFIVLYILIFKILLGDVKTKS
jgi:hypothetical protein